MMSREHPSPTRSQQGQFRASPPILPPLGSSGGASHGLAGGRYRLEEVIGEGALGTLWRARQTNIGREVAIKILRRDISAHPITRRKLIERVHRVQKLRHPNNCRLLDVGEANGSLYLVMELLRGAPLRSVIDHGAPYPVGWALDIGLQILDGLGEAHQLGIIHRNLKPRNIFLLPRRRGGLQVKITDYALASCLDIFPDEDPEETRPAEICGTAAYLAPETLVHQVSLQATDVYAAALVLIEMLTGQQVFHGNSLSEVLYRQIHMSVTLPRKLAWTSLGKALEQAASKDPDHRFIDADAFYEALREASERTAPYFRLNLDDLSVFSPRTQPPLC